MKVSIRRVSSAVETEENENDDLMRKITCIGFFQMQKYIEKKTKFGHNPITQIILCYIYKCIDK